MFLVEGLQLSPPLN